MFFNILAIYAEFEVELIRMRTREGMTIACARGKLRGQQPKLADRQQRELCRMHTSGEYSISDLAAFFSFSRPTGSITICVRSCPYRTRPSKERRKVTDKQFRLSEGTLQVFVSSRQDPKDEEISRARELAIDEVANYPGMKDWAFEDAPTSSEAARDRYIKNAERADLVIWLIGSTTTTPITTWYHRHVVRNNLLP